MNKKNQKRLQMLKESYRHHKKGLFITVLVIFALVICVPQVDALIHPKCYIACSGDTLEVTVSYYAKNDEAGQRVVSIPRGSEVELRELGEKTSTIVYKNETLTVDNDHLVDNLEDAIQIKYVYPRRLLNLLINKQGKLSDMVVRKGEKVKVVSVKTEDLDRKTGRIQWYQVKKNGKKYWINGAHVETTKSLRIQPIGMIIMVRDTPKMPMLIKSIINHNRPLGMQTIRFVRISIRFMFLSVT